jgi:hypothetical protein
MHGSQRGPETQAKKQYQPSLYDIAVLDSHISTFSSKTGLFPSPFDPARKC